MTSFQLSMSVIVPVIIGTISYFKFSSYGRYLVFFFWLCFIVEIANYSMAVLYGNNIPVIYLFVSIASPLLGYAYAQLLNRQVVLWWFFIVPVVAIGEGLLTGFFLFNSYSFTVFNLLIIVVALLTFGRIVVGDVDPGVFWFNGVMFFYSISSSVVFVSAKYLQVADVELMQKLVTIHEYVNATTNLLFGLTLWILSKSYSSVRS